MATEKTPNYSKSQEAFIASFKGTGEGGALTLADAGRIAADPSMKAADGSVRSARSIVAKINRMGLPYARKVATRKDGSPVQTKADIVAEIAKLAGVERFENLTVAARGDLVKLRDVLAA